MRHTRILLLAAPALLASCGGGEAVNDAAAANVALTDNGTVEGQGQADMTGVDTNAQVGLGGNQATARLRLADGRDAGTATAVAENGGLSIRFTGLNLPAGVHGVHVHTTGRCDPPGFTTAGAHWNPTSRQHGSENPQGAHAGDIPNLTVAADGTGTVSFASANAAMTGATGLLDADGAAFVVHAKADDYRTDPSGDSGDRIACGVFAAG